MRRSLSIALLVALPSFAAVGCDDSNPATDSGIDSSRPDSGTPDSGLDSGTDAGSDAGSDGGDAGTPTCPTSTDSSPSRSCYLSAPVADCFVATSPTQTNHAKDAYYLNRCAPTKTCSPVSVTIPETTWKPGTPLPPPQ